MSSKENYETKQKKKEQMQEKRREKENEERRCFIRNVIESAKKRKLERYQLKEDPNGEKIGPEEKIPDLRIYTCDNSKAESDNLKAVIVKKLDEKNEEKHRTDKTKNSENLRLKRQIFETGKSTPKNNPRSISKTEKKVAKNKEIDPRAPKLTFGGEAKLEGERKNLAGG